jgi:hypothetical protein
MAEISTFLRYPGSKRRMLAFLLEHIPETASDFVTKPIDEFLSSLPLWTRHSSTIGGFDWPHLNRRVCSRAIDH